ncbi:MAG: porin, partial [Rhizobacter sp.]
GILDAGFGSFHTFDTTGGTITAKHNTQVNNGLMDASFIGFRGSEDLGGGNKAIFSIESYLDVTNGKSSGGGDTGVDSSNTNFWARNTFVGLEGGYGRVTLGHTDSLAYQAATTYDAFGASDYFGVARLAFDPVNVTGATFHALDQGWSKVITYTSPDMSGFNVAAQYAPKGGQTTEGANWGLAANYNNGPLGLNATYEQIRRPYDTTVNPAGAKDKVWLLNGSYDFSVVKAFLQYGQTKYQDSIPTNAKYKVWDLGVSAPVGASGSIMAAYGQRKDTGSSLDQQLRDFSIGYNYNLSKRTFVYVAALNERLKLTSDSKSSNTFAVGVHHTF